LRLAAVTDELERQSLNVLEEHLVEDAEEKTRDSVLRLGDLNDIVEDASLPEEVRIAAQFYIDNDTRRNALDVADQSGGNPDQKIFISDIHQRQLELNEDIDNIIIPANRGRWYLSVAKW